jgi:hypothetical protein
MGSGGEGTTAGGGAAVIVGLGTVVDGEALGGVPEGLGVAEEGTSVCGTGEDGTALGDGALEGRRVD